MLFTKAEEMNSTNLLINTYRIPVSERRILIFLLKSEKVEHMTISLMITPLGAGTLSEAKDPHLTGSPRL